MKKGLLLGVGLVLLLSGVCESVTKMSTPSFQTYQRVTNDTISLHNPSFKPWSFQQSIHSDWQLSATTIRSQEVELVSKVLVYPNPSRSADGFEVGYALSANANIELLIFNIRGREVYQTTYFAGAEGGRSTEYNLKKITPDLIGAQLPSGPYFLVLRNNGNVIGQTKVAIVP